MKLLQRFKSVPYFFQYLYEKVTTSIAFYPSLLALFFFMLISLLIFLEQNGLTAWMETHLPIFLLIKSWDVAQSVLTTLVGALISLMVFSFSMVMVLLNNAASNFSPRILPGLIADKFHQFVLGFYLGTITFCLVLVINMTPSQPEISLPGFSVLMGIFLGLTCLMLFVFFIHSISESVQVGKILESLRYTTLQNLKESNHGEWSAQMDPPNMENWHIYESDRSGHLNMVDFNGLHRVAEENDFKIKVLVPKSKFILEGIALFACDRKLTEELLQKVLKVFVFGTKEYAEKDHVIGFKQITEIAVKAMSPGINDPGTAITAIDHLSILFVEKMKSFDQGGVLVKDESAQNEPIRIWLTAFPFATLLSFVLTPLRQYARHDAMVVFKMFEMLRFLASRSHCHTDHQKTIQQEIEILKIDAKAGFTNSVDYQRLLESMAAEKT